MIPSISFFSRVVLGCQPVSNSIKSLFPANFSIASYSASVSVVSEADPPNSNILRLWNRKSYLPCLSKRSLITLWRVCCDRTILLMSSHCDRRSPPDLYKMWNFSRLRDFLILRQHLSFMKHVQQESRIACRLVKINFLYLPKFWLISTLTISERVKVWCFFVITRFSSSCASC